MTYPVNNEVFQLTSYHRDCAAVWELFWKGTAACPCLGGLVRALRCRMYLTQQYQMRYQVDIGVNHTICLTSLWQQHWSRRPAALQEQASRLGVGVPHCAGALLFWSIMNDIKRLHGCLACYFEVFACRIGMEVWRYLLYPLYEEFICKPLINLRPLACCFSFFSMILFFFSPVTCNL